MESAARTNYPVSATSIIYRVQQKAEVRMRLTMLSALLLNTIVSVPLGAGWRVEGDTSYKPPAQPLTPPEKSAKFDAPRDLVWTAAVSYLSQTAFAIDQISKESGLI